MLKEKKAAASVNYEEEEDEHDLEEKQEDTVLSDSDDVVFHDLSDDDSSELGKVISEDNNRYPADREHVKLLKKEVQISSGRRATTWRTRFL